MMYETATNIINEAHKIIVIQGENPDGDSIGSSVALEEILSDQGKEVVMYCQIDVPKYLRYIKGWDRIVTDFDTSADMAIIVDTAAETLLSKALGSSGVRHFLETHPVLVIDHHTTQSDLTFEHTILSQDVVATSEVIYGLAESNDWSINQSAAEAMMIAVMSDTLGLTTQAVGAGTFELCSKLASLGANASHIEERRREYMKKPQDILSYKGELIGRIEYLLNGRLAVVHIPWEDIQQYSDRYNPSILVLDEMRLVEGVEIAVAIKTYPDGKLTGKLRANTPIAETVAGYFGGGGHEYSAGFRVYEDYDKIINELIEATDKALNEHDSKAS